MAGAFGEVRTRCVHRSGASAAAAAARGTRAANGQQGQRPRATLQPVRRLQTVNIMLDLHTR